MNSTLQILVIDNFDSFTYNLVHLIEALDCKFRVVRNDELDQLKTDEFTHLIIGPGPGLPATSGQLMKFLHSWPESKPILGICLGMQAILEQDGGEIENLPVVFHGAQDLVYCIDESALFEGISKNFKAGRYHSWGFRTSSIPDQYRIIADDSNNLTLAIEHKDRPWFGVQFHPESIMTEFGMEIMRNFLVTEKTSNPEMELSPMN